MGAMADIQRPLLLAKPTPRRWLQTAGRSTAGSDAGAGLAIPAAPAFLDAMLRPSLIGLFALAFPVAAIAAPAPRMSIRGFEELKTPLPYPYDEAANADRAVARAKARAKREKKLLLVDLGGNWCGDCRILTATMDRPELKAFLDRHYVTVLVDVGHFDKNLQVPAHWGITERLDGVPAILVVDPKTDKLRNPGVVSDIQDARHMTPQALADWLAQWVH
jgi:thiol-disulfide isomerase/thioredoxin